ENLDVAKGGEFGIFVNAYESSPVQNLKLVNCHIRGVKIPMQMDFVKGLSFEKVTINGTTAIIPEKFK
ncbi:MAG: glycoside hydrolase family 28 protein, partial [Dyadobacter sp.]